MKRLIVALCVVCAGYAGATAPAWQDQGAQSVREVWRFRTSAGVVTVANNYRAYISGADSSAIGNQADFTAIPADSSYYLGAMKTGAPVRAGRFDIYKIGAGADSLVYSYAYINGRKLGKYAVDDTSIVRSSITMAAMDTTQIVTETEPSSVHLEKVLTVDGELHTGTDIWCDGIVTAIYGVQTTSDNFIASDDTLYCEAGGWFTDKLLVGSGSTFDWLKVNGALHVTGVATLGGTAVTGAISATTKIAASDSVSGYKGLIAGKSSTEGTVKMWDGSANTLLLRPCAMAANDTLYFPPTRAGYKDSSATMAYVRNRTPHIFAADTLLFNTNRTLWGDRVGSKYVPGTLATDIVITGLSSVAIGGAGSGRIMVVPVTDSIQVTFGSGQDNMITTYMVIHR